MLDITCGRGKVVLFWRDKMESKILEEMRKSFKHEVIAFDWEPNHKRPRSKGIFYRIIGRILNLTGGEKSEVSLFSRKGGKSYERGTINYEKMKWADAPGYPEGSKIKILREGGPGEGKTFLRKIKKGFKM